MEREACCYDSALIEGFSYILFGFVLVNLGRDLLKEIW